jgi:ribose transport system ATP-binding protein
MIALNVEKASVHFGPTRALNDVSLTVESGEVLGLVGHNGAGKSTLINAINDSTLLSAGTIWSNGQQFHANSPHAARAAGIYTVFQELTIFPHLSVLENIFAGSLQTRGIVLDRQTMRRKATAALSNLGHSIPLDSPAENLSLADQQIIEIVRATVNGARVLLLDEPTSSLNAVDRARLFNLIRTLKSQGCAVIYISHFLGEVLEITDRYTVLRDGAVVAAGNTGDTTVPELSEAMFGRAVDHNFRRSSEAQAPGDVVLSVSELKTRGVQSADLEVGRGEVVSIFGLDDSGGPELLEAIFGLRPIESGTVTLPQSKGTNRLATRWQPQGMGMVPPERPTGLATDRTVAENILAPYWQPVLKFGFVSPALVLAATNYYIQRFGIKCDGPNQQLGSLSGGHQQRVEFARFSNVGVDLLLLIQPTRGVDVASRIDLWRFIDALANKGRAVVFFTSDVDEAMALSDSVVVMRRGRLLGKRPTVSISPEQLLIEATQEGVQ